MTIASLLGMEFFAFRVRFEIGSDEIAANKTVDAMSPRLNFDNYIDGIITVFIILTCENWNSI